MGLGRQESKGASGLQLLLAAGDTHLLRHSPVEDEDVALADAARFVFDLSESEAEALCPGEDLLSCLSALIDQRVELDELPSSSADHRPGRLGPSCVEADHVAGQLSVGCSSLSLQSLANFSSLRANACVFAGRWQYEATVCTPGIQQIGWATLQCPFTSEEGVGDAPDSYAFDGKRVMKWHVKCTAYGE
ncbi:E3 ubiquitin-protein ligase, partial [Tetrabaena socialis]